MKKKVIVIEGSIDGVGKSTQFEKIKEYLDSKGIKYLAHHFPSYNKYYGEGVKRYLNGEYGKQRNLDPYFVHMLYAYDRSLFFKDIKDKDYDLLLFDRYLISSMIYQSVYLEEKEKLEFIKYIKDLEYQKLGVLKPDLVLFLNGDYEIIKAKRDLRNKEEGKDLHEKDESFLRKVYDNANYLNELLDFSEIKVTKDNDFRKIDDIFNDIKKEIDVVLDER